MTDTIEKRRKFIINFFYYTIIIILFCLFLRYAFTPMLPLIIAVVVAVILQGPVNKVVERTKIPKGVVSAVMVLLLMAVVGVVIFLISGRLVNEVKSFIDFIRMKIEDYAWIEAQVYSVTETLPSFMHDSVMPHVTEFLERLKPAMESDATSGVYKIGFAAIDFPAIISNYFGDVWNTAKQIPSLLVAVIICIVASCFMTAEYDLFSDAIRKYAPGGDRNIISATKRVLISSVGKLLKAYFLIMCITFLEMLVGLGIFQALGIFNSNYILAIALLSAVFDILPIVGIGAILWTWSAFAFISGDIALGIALIILYGVITVIRQIIEPKLVAGQMSLPPALTISVMYIGLKTFGVIGMFAFTIALYCIKVMDSEGIIHIFGNSDGDTADTAENTTDADGDAPTGEDLPKKSPDKPKKRLKAAKDTAPKV